MDRRAVCREGSMFEDDESDIGKLDETEESWETSEGSGEGDADDAIVGKRRRERRRTHADPEPTQETRKGSERKSWIEE